MIIYPILFVAILAVFLVYTIQTTRKFIFSPENAPKTRFTLVLGAGLKKNGQPTDILADRIITACKLIEKGRTDYLIMSGSIRNGHYNEPESMKNYAISRGVAASAILIDRNGTTTFRSCVNVLQNQNPKDILIVTQNFHLPRALLIARAMGMNVFGVQAIIFQFSALKKVFWSIREIFSIPVNLLRICAYYLGSNMV